MLHVYIGHDDREEEAYQVCRFSIERRASAPVAIHPLKHRDLRAAGHFTRPWLVSELGQYIDQRDGRPFSTQFAFTRFLTPFLARGEAADNDVPWALFIDCDFLVLDDVHQILMHADPTKAVACVQHAYDPPEGVKMDGMAQTRYRRKAWSSCVLFNLRHRANDLLTPYIVNHQPGSWLHGFGWLDDGQIGAIAPGWNHIVGTPTPSPLHAVHFSEGGPWMAGYEHVPFADEWRAERKAMRVAEDDRETIRRAFA